MKKDERTKLSVSIYLVIGAIIILAAVYFLIPLFTPDTYTFSVKNTTPSSSQNSAEIPTETIIPENVQHIKTPASVKAIYMSACAVGTPSFRTTFENLLKTTELNSVMIDIKDFSGRLSFTPHDPTLVPYVSDACGARDMKDYIASLHQRGVYVIGRVTTFQDPYFTKIHPESAIKSKSTGGIWKDKNGLAYIDPASKEAWDHVVAIASSSYDIGFDEINFDYIRYPSDGNVRDISLPSGEGTSKSAVLESFFSYLNSKMQEKGIIHSADLFGMTTTNNDDLGIGQVLERAMPYFDFIDPMVYPSHYPPGFNGWQNPNAYPYDLIHYVMASAVKRTIATSTLITVKGSKPIASTTPQLYTKPSYDAHKMRPWIQDFNLGKPAYTSELVRAQIQATYDVGLNSWLVWNAANHYSADAFHSKSGTSSSE